MIMSKRRQYMRKVKRKKVAKRNTISRKDEIIGILAIALVFIVAAIAAYYYSLSKVS
tara:strand:+ start:3456 stop:3626 length:171 start_codon:yes stop_codon:yes gene_type:complete